MTNTENQTSNNIHQTSNDEHRNPNINQQLLENQGF